jgi:adenine-specific DNA-methyltransferase
MTPEETKKIIQDAIHAFAEGDLTRNTLELFKKLGYNTDRQAPMDVPDFATFREFFIGEKPFNEERAKVSDWKHVDLLFQLTKEEVQQQISMFDTGKVDQTIIEAYLFFAIELTEESYTRTELSQITREVNRLFPMPVMLLFKYGSLLTLSVINRRIDKRDEHKDVLEKVTQIKDISIQAPHRAHIEILFDLSFDELKRRHKVTNFVELHNAWQKTLDTKELNKRFYKELANWYFWAKDMVHFPDDIEKNAEVRNATNLIRLITRLIFIWFIKEKHLVPEQLFNQSFLKKILKSFLASGNSSDYYNAILQNLFFGTLNQKVDDRKFAADGDRSANVKEYGIKNLFRYSGMFAISEAEVIQLFREIPFLNGGLFDCLDKTKTDGKVEYGDGFSRNPQKMALIPDAIFFGKEKVVDLNPIYGTKNKKYITKGLFNLLASYKFTVTENTPIDEEVALDPELLGKTFENLLASYNPETQTTARKQTGSFYTPREIVNYMVDESLIEYLKQAAEVKSEAFDAKIRDLFAFNENHNPFPEAETRKLIEALNGCKILDPACGSGAFPMGILHKMVHVLQKLDPENLHWRELQEQKAISETREAYKIGNQEERDRRLKEISDVFENNTSDYGRKLYLIENCIYGVDIQPIAVQISKLRFFISLIIDQKADKGKKNFGIRSLPNLETKFVAANTLITLDKPVETTGNLFLSEANERMLTLKEQLKEIRHRYFTATNRKEKLAYQKDDLTTRNEIAKLLTQEGWKTNVVQQIVSYDPYDQNTFANWFEPEWMFGINQGFDVVIGNPPYVNISNLKPNDYRMFLQKLYRSARNKSDMYAFFIEASFALLQEAGVSAFVIPQTWKATDSFLNLREIIFKEHTLLKLVDLNFGTFEAIVKPMIGIFSNLKNFRRKIEVFNQDFAKVSEIDINEILQDKSLTINTSSSIEQKGVFFKMEKGSNRLEDIIQFSRGIKTSDDNRFIVNQQKDTDCKPVFRGKNIRRYQLNWNGEYVWYRPDLMKEKVGSVSYNKEFFEVPMKLVTQRVNSSMQLICAIDMEQNYFLDTTNLSRYETWNKRTPLKYICALLNSKALNFWYCNKFQMPTIGIYELHSIPIKLSDSNTTNRLVGHVDTILTSKQSDPHADTTALENRIDELVFKLYDLTYEEVKVIVPDFWLSEEEYEELDSSNLI